MLIRELILVVLAQGGSHPAQWRDVTNTQPAGSCHRQETAISLALSQGRLPSGLAPELLLDTSGGAMFFQQLCNEGWGTANESFGAAVQVFKVAGIAAAHVLAQ